MNPPTDDPLQYCRFCFSQFRVEPLLSNGPKDEQLVNQISSLIQIELDPNQAATTAICSMCRQQLAEFQLFRDRCTHHDAIVRQKIDGNQCSQNDLWFAVEPLGDGEDSDGGIGPPTKNDPLQDASDVVSKRRTRDSFWRAISQDVGVIPDHIKRALELTGFYRNASLGMISPMTIKQIEQDMRDTVEYVISSKGSLGGNRWEVLRQYYGAVYCKIPSKFKFLAGEVQTILSITAAVQENGINEYLSKACVTHSRKERLNAADKPDDAETLTEKLADKIQDYYRQHANDSEEFGAFFARLPGVDTCVVRQREDGTIIGLMYCSYCNMHLQVTRDGNSWRIHNFVKHCQQHYRVEYRTVKKK
ncbi:uncharacterized protein LOC128093071 [Culex pipiens pallens]|uniref:uncharacterized protein LOC128093071 n=1 Tax=Culex pipiens pallens TaxID=42434 RepID=UPI0022AAF204|nr:uncharacterized protein LOC128093071 [Culex pipiens pallens]